MAITTNRNKETGYELFEVACFEGDRNTPHMVDVGRKLKAAGQTGIHDHNAQ